MEDENLKRIYNIIDSIPITSENESEIDNIKKLLKQNDIEHALDRIKILTEPLAKRKEKKKAKLYPDKLLNSKLEETYIGLVLENPKLIAKYYFMFEDCLFDNPELLNIYKSIIFTEGEAYTPEIAKRNFNFSKDTEQSFKLKTKLKRDVLGKRHNMEKIFVELKKLFILRKYYNKIPIERIQNSIVEITDYLLYDQMSVEEVEDAINQVTTTEKFKRAVLNTDLTEFLELGDNNLTNGLELPFHILTNVFKGIRKGETMAYAMPSNSGKSRFTIYLAACTAFLHKKKVLLISNEMSEDKMRLCLITTILNNPMMQELHGQKICKTEGEILEFKYRLDKGKKAKVDENGFILKEKGESQVDFVERLKKISTEFNQTVAVTDWVNNEIDNSIYFINITDHTNDELKKVIINYYYKEKIEYVFYDTLKTDTANIGNGEELKKTATILSNLAQNLEIFICSTLQLAENTTLPINLNVNDLAVSRTVKEVLDTLCLIKQINSDHLCEYEYSHNEVDTVFYDIKKPEDPDIRYYAWVVDKNRAGAKPTLVFKLNLAYNSWEELGYLRMKQK